MGTEHTSRKDRELWRSLAAAPALPQAPVSELDFAAWLEGRLPEAAAARVEAAVAADPELRRAALDLAEVLGTPLPAAPTRLAVRAKALVGFEAERHSARGGLLSRLLPRGRSFALQRAVTLAAAVLIAGGGFMLGGGLGESMAQERYAVTTSQASPTTDASNELADLFTVDGI
ncbi:MAG: hypothetical protein ACOY4R_12180 [Pseudomonadota bacterium]